MALQLMDASLTRVVWLNVYVPCLCLMSSNPSNLSDVLAPLNARDWPTLNAHDWPTLNAPDWPMPNVL